MKRVAELVEKIRTDASAVVQEGGEVILQGAIAKTRPVQYCYEFFKPLTEEEITRLAEEYRNPFPAPLAAFYRVSNGAFLFGRHISIYGMPLWSAQYKQPMALAFADGHRTKNCPASRLFFACYNAEPEIQLFFDTQESGTDMKVYAARHGSNDVIAQWPSLADWFISEHDKYLAKYRAGAYRQTVIVKNVLEEISFDMEL